MLISSFFYVHDGEGKRQLTDCCASDQDVKDRIKLDHLTAFDLRSNSTCMKDSRRRARTVEKVQQRKVPINTPEKTILLVTLTRDYDECSHDCSK